MKIAQSIADLVGHTPLLEPVRYNRAHGLRARLLVKPEYFNPAGSVKDRIAKAIIEDAERTGRLQPGGTVIEPTSGNAGIGLAAVAAAKGYRTILTMPDTMSVERRNILKAYGAEIVLTEGSLGMKGAIAKAQQLHEQTPASVIAGQFDNPVNPATHYATTGPEIWEDTDGTVDVLVAGVGTGGTISGTGKFLKEKKRSVYVVAVEPASSAVLSTGIAGSHKIQGIGAGFVPAVLDTSVYDEVIAVDNDVPFETAKELGRTDGIPVGISSGAALWAATQLALRPKFEGKTIVVILPDSADRYFSTPLFT